MDLATQVYNEEMKLPWKSTEKDKQQQKFRVWIPTPRRKPKRQEILYKFGEYGVYPSSIAQVFPNPILHLRQTHSIISRSLKDDSL